MKGSIRMVELFNKVFNETMKKYHVTWYELIESDLMEVVTFKIARILHMHPGILQMTSEFKSWVDEMYEDL